MAPERSRNERNHRSHDSTTTSSMTSSKIGHRTDEGRSRYSHRASPYARHPLSHVSARQSEREATATSNGYAAPHDVQSSKQIQNQTIGQHIAKTQQHPLAKRRGGDASSDNEASTTTNNSKTQQLEIETDHHRLSQRQKQLDIGKNTVAYERYLVAVPKNNRVTSRKYTDQPVTPLKTQVCSKRAWDGQVRKWRRLLHQYSLPGTTLQDDDGDADEQIVPAAVPAPPTTSVSASLLASPNSLLNGSLQYDLNVHSLVDDLLNESGVLPSNIEATAVAAGDGEDGVDSLLAQFEEQAKSNLAARS